MKPSIHARRGEQGAVFVQVGIAIFVLMAFNVFVMDYGVMWIARGQAQNAADAGALAGAVARGYDDFSSSPSQSGVAANSARNVARANVVWQQQPTPVVRFECPTGVSGRCVRVDVFRNGESGSQNLPAFFGPILGVANQGVRATATAIAGNGNATTCMKPWAMPDEWSEAGSGGHWDPADTFVRYDASGALVPNPDSYLPPSASSAPSVNIGGHFGERLLFEVGQPMTSPITPGFVLPLALPGVKSYAQNMSECNGQPIALGQRIPLDTVVTSTEVEDALQDAYDLDPGADYNYGDSYVINTCAPSCAAVSPRLFSIVLFDPDDFQWGLRNGWSRCPSGTPCVRVANIVGFFVHRLSGSLGRHGHFLKYPGGTTTGAPTFANDASWLVTTHLIR